MCNRQCISAEHEHIYMLCIFCDNDSVAALGRFHWTVVEWSIEAPTFLGRSNPSHQVMVRHGLLSLPDPSHELLATQRV